GIGKLTVWILAALERVDRLWFARYLNQAARRGQRKRAPR
ncbi:MAG: hypothetical protein ACJASJ_000640, partial [Candidatus Azotimanducaceae bacterium]